MQKGKVFSGSSSFSVVCVKRWKCKVHQVTEINISNVYHRIKYHKTFLSSRKRERERKKMLRKYIWTTSSSETRAHPHKTNRKENEAKHTISETKNCSQVFYCTKYCVCAFTVFACVLFCTSLKIHDVNSCQIVQRARVDVNDKQIEWKDFQ